MAIPERDPRNDMRLYTRYALTSAGIWEEREIRAEYSRLRDIAQKRLQRLGRSEPDSYAYRENVGAYAPARGLTTAQIVDLLPDLARFITARAGSVSGIRAIRRQTLQTLHERGYDFVNARNLREFGEYMEDWRSRRELHSIGSVEAAEFYGWASEHKVDVDRIRADFAGWLSKREELKNYTRQQNEAGQTVSANMIYQEFDRLKRAEEARRRAEKRGRGRRR